MKEFKTYRQQWKILRSRGLEISGISGDDYLEYNYYKLVNGYKDPFIDTSSHLEKFKNGTTIKDIISLHNFDKKLGAIIFEDVLIVERKIKSIFAYYFSKENLGTGYESIKSFDKKVPHSKKISQIARILSKISKSKSIAIKHYLKEYDTVPLWVLIEELELGIVKNLFDMSTHKVQDNVAKHFGLSKEEFKSYFKAIYFIRNKIAHNNRIYDIQNYKFYNKYKKKLIREISIPNSSYHSKNVKVNAEGVPVRAKHDIAAVLIAINHFRGAKHFHELLLKIDNLLGNTSFGSSVKVWEIKGIMGIPKNIFEFEK